ncbi:hypothetical protein PHLGIDRAFT_356040 [Phlebiopsis gigantea 11061_1 CR5-6]|uniref:Uncharacterized protein n=1 Tax=Phlebiopsis gigantea (strain 11061_1 CR5-6) TaxID=745531 RepID=A0A0C3P9Q7_PHLG1|nr:hypothetical protein PHLGIDRAFT_356040 [Phlebiopsis gigantea 11061_1 CR5-6]
MCRAHYTPLEYAVAVCDGSSATRCDHTDAPLCAVASKRYLSTSECRCRRTSDEWMQLVRAGGDAGGQTTATNSGRRQRGRQADSGGSSTSTNWMHASHLPRPSTARRVAAARIHVCRHQSCRLQVVAYPLPVAVHGFFLAQVAVCSRTSRGRRLAQRCIRPSPLEFPSRPALASPRSRVGNGCSAHSGPEHVVSRPRRPWSLEPSATDVSLRCASVQVTAGVLFRVAVRSALHC